MFDPNSPEFSPPAPPPGREGPEVVQAFLSRHRSFFILVAVLLAQLLLLSVQITRSNKVRLIQVWAVAVFDPFDRALHGMAEATAGAWQTYSGLWHAHQENQELHLQLVAARAQIQQLSERGTEAERLRVLLEFRQRLPFQSVAAEVIATGPGEASRTVFIDKGRDAGLGPDLAVITPAGVVGKTIAVFPYSSQVMLVTDPSSGAGALLEQARIQGILKGSGQSQCELHYVMNEDSVAVGEMILTSGLDQVYPKGLPLGRVVSVGEGNIYKKIAVKPAAALDRLESVLVVLKPASDELQAQSAPTRP